MYTYNIIQQHIIEMTERTQCFYRNDQLKRLFILHLIFVHAFIFNFDILFIYIYSCGISISFLKIVLNKTKFNINFKNQNVIDR
jgi:hypothetical protein